MIRNRFNTKGSISDSNSSNKNNIKKKPNRTRLFFNIIKYIVLIIILITLVIIYLLYTRLGISTPFPDNYSHLKPTLSSNQIDIAAYLPIPPGNIAISSDNTIYFNFHPEYNPVDIKIAQLINKNTWIPFPSKRFQKEIITVLSLRIDALDRLWLLDYAQHGIKGSPKLYAFDLKTTTEINDKPVIAHTFPSDIAGFGSMLNDFQIDFACKYIYIIDTSIIAHSPALIVYDIIEYKSYRLLSSDSKLYGDSHSFSISNYLIKFGIFGMKINADSIALTRDGKYLYIGAVTSTNLYRISTDKVIKSLNNIYYNLQLTIVSTNKPATDGLTTDNSGNIWLTAFEYSSIGVLNTVTNEITNIIVNDSLIRWPDGLSFGLDGLYLTNSALHYKLGKSTSDNVSKHLSLFDAHGPFHILKIKYDDISEIIGNQLPTNGQ